MMATGATFADRFTMEGVIGEGGFATVYRATDQTTGTKVALKLLHVQPNSTSHTEAIARFRREVSIVARLRDPHTVQYIAHGELDRQPWVAFELLDGEDLSELLTRHGTLPPAQVAAIVRQILLSLREAHQHGLIHRDLKPSNVRVLPNGMIKVLDFGIARTETHDDKLTKTGVMVGTPRYMSPEQLRGERLTAASDIYSIGMIGFELLAGESALAGGSLFHQVARAMPGHEFTLNTTDTEALALLAVLQSFLEFDVTQRASTAAAALARLDGIPPHTGQLPAKTAPNRRALVGAGIAVAVIASAIALVAANTTEPEDEPVLPAASLRENPLATVGEADEPHPMTALDAETDSADSADSATGCVSAADQGFSTLLGPTGTEFQVYTPPPNEQPPAMLLLLSSGMALPQALHQIDVKARVDRENLTVVLPPSRRGAWQQERWEQQMIDDVGESIAAVRQALCLHDRELFIIGLGAGAIALDYIVDGEQLDHLVATASLFGRYQLVARRNFRQLVDPDAARPVTPPPTGHVPHIEVDTTREDSKRVPPEVREARLRGDHRCKSGDVEEVDGCRRFDCEVSLEICRTATTMSEEVTFDRSETVWAFFQEHRTAVSDSAAHP